MARRCVYCPHRHAPGEPHGKTGAEELRHIVNLLDMSREGASDPFNAEELIRIVRACLASEWDILPDNLTLAERKYAAKHGKLSAAANRRLDKELGVG